MDKAEYTLTAAVAALAGALANGEHLNFSPAHAAASAKAAGEALADLMFPDPE